MSVYHSLSRVVCLSKFIEFFFRLSQSIEVYFRLSQFIEFKVCLLGYYRYKFGSYFSSFFRYFVYFKILAEFIYSNIFLI